MENTEAARITAQIDAVLSHGDDDSEFALEAGRRFLRETEDEWRLA
ncbi:hypothetical protein [Citricoccus sp. I39-566]|nr:hypothetical protein [Citricoccus sp. I39-566]WMY77994.1 hypothetical protein RE421_14385 [Citricoccus sp. I39-566]